MKDTLNLSLRLALICALAALLLSQVDNLTRGPIAEAVRKAKMEAVSAVLPAFDNAPDASMVMLAGADGDSVEFYVGKMGDEVTGVAFQALTQQGYSGEIAVMMGIDPDGRVEGVRMLRHAETPGLGAKYAAPDVLDAFYAGRALGDTDWRVAKDGGDLDAVTGATITGRALGQAIQAGLRNYETLQEKIIAGAQAAPAGEAGP